MKKLAIVLTLISSVAFAQKSMIRFDVNGSSSSDVSNFDLSMSTEDNGATDKETKKSNILVNYAYTVAPQWQVGITLGKQSLDDDGTNEGSTMTTGLSVYWNAEEDLSNTCYLGLHYNMIKANVDKGAVDGYSEDDSANQIILEYGHRFNLGKLWGANVTYSPAVAYSMTTFTDDSADEDIKTNALAWNWLKFDMLF